MIILHKAKEIINSNSLLQSLYDSSKSIIHIIPFFVVREGLIGHGEDEVCPKIDAKALEVVFLSQKDMRSISEIPGVKETEQELLNRLEGGCQCLGLKFNSTIIAYMWSNLHYCDSKLLRFPLKEDEAYLTDARTIEEFKGRNLAPYLRYRFYRYLNDMGRTIIYSITEYFNRPAMAFKKKLGAKPVSLYLHISLFKKFIFTIRLKKY